ncbi:unnamed protein product [Diatraea saccharalis]|uniref:Uncharacterized protein n=1 Tax=Diatraea saccharalis TaxID=40085 RepID=A0A9N9WF45_9NEOP|nr:unnamed protein product [Diatraea saccharalis]
MEPFKTHGAILPQQELTQSVERCPSGPRPEDLIQEGNEGANPHSGWRVASDAMDHAIAGTSYSLEVFANTRRELDDNRGTSGRSSQQDNSGEGGRSDTSVTLTRLEVYKLLIKESKQINSKWRPLDLPVPDRCAAVLKALGEGYEPSMSNKELTRAIALLITKCDAIYKKNHYKMNLFENDKKTIEIEANLAEEPKAKKIKAFVQSMSGSDESTKMSTKVAKDFEFVIDQCLQSGSTTIANKIRQPSPQPYSPQEALAILEKLLVESLDAASLLAFKGRCLAGDSARNLLSAVIAKAILNENKNSPISGAIYYKWANYIKELFPAERTTTYYIPACTTANGIVLQAKGKLVNQVLKKRRHLQNLGALPMVNRKRSREESPTYTESNPSPRPIPDIFIGEEDNEEDIKDDILWLENSADPWYLVEEKWQRTQKIRAHFLYGSNDASIETYFGKYLALRQPHGYSLVNNNIVF